MSKTGIEQENFAPTPKWLEWLAIAGGVFTLLFVGGVFWALIALHVALNGAPL